MLLLLLLVEYAFVTLKQKNISWSGLNQLRYTLDEGVIEKVEQLRQRF